MAYNTGMMNKRIKVAKRVDSEGGSFGRSSGGQKYTLLGEFWASEKFDKGMKSLREGAVDAYNTVMFRMRYNADIDRWCLIQYQGRWYQIQSFNEDYQTNELQITATEMANQKVTIVPQPSNSEISDSDISGGVPDHTEIGI
jgi:SPP1 family predicted phage head-tail adaptor